MNEPEEADELWRLLGKAPQREVSPFFARNVSRAVRDLDAERERGRGWGWLRSWKLAVPATIAVCAAAAFVSSPEDQPDPLEVIAAEVSDSPDYLVISDLDELLASEESSVWLDSPAY